MKRLILSVLPYWPYREWRFWARWVPLGCRLLDLGCARGFEVESVGVRADGDMHPRLAVQWFANEYRDVSEDLAALVDKSETILANPIRLAWYEVRLGMRGVGEAERSRLDDALFVTTVLRKR